MTEMPTTYSPKLQLLLRRTMFALSLFLLYLGSLRSQDKPFLDPWLPVAVSWSASWSDIFKEGNLGHTGKVDFSSMTRIGKPSSGGISASGSQIGQRRWSWQGLFEWYFYRKRNGMTLWTVFKWPNLLIEVVWLGSKGDILGPVCLSKHVLNWYDWEIPSNSNSISLSNTGMTKIESWLQLLNWARWRLDDVSDFA